MDEDTEAALELLGRLRGLIARSKELTTSFPEGATPEQLFQLLLAIFEVRVDRSLKSVEVLATEGLWSDLAVILRSIFELYIQTEYLSQEPASRTVLFVEYSAVSRYQLYQAVRKVGWMSTEQLEPAREEIERHYEAVKDRYRTRNRWSGKSIKKMAEELGADEMYETVYATLSAYAHSSPQTIGRHAVPGGRGFAMIKEETLSSYSSTLVNMAVVYSVPIVIRKSNAFGLRLDGDLKGLLARFSGA